MKTYLLVFFLIGPLAVTALPQSGRGRTSSPSRDDQGTIRLSTEEAILPINVTELKDQQIPLRPQDLTVVENGANHQVTSVNRAPASVVFLVDNCVFNSAAKFKDVDLNRDLALNIISRLPKTDRVAVVTYADRVNVVSGWTSNRDELRRQLRWKFKPGNKPLLYKALLYIADQMLPEAPDPRVVVLITDGVSAEDPDVLEDARQALGRTRTTLYIAGQNALILNDLKPGANSKVARVINILEPDARKIQNDQRQYAGSLEAASLKMQTLAVASGGKEWNPDTRNGFVDLQRQILREIGSEYVISYLTEPGKKAGEFRGVKVLCTNPGVVVRVREKVYVGEKKPSKPAN